jgi:fatty acid desaturase
MFILRFLPGIIIAQAATAVLVFAFMENTKANWLPYVLLALIASLLTAFWLASIANHIKKDALARMKEGLVREREQLLVTTEKEKSRVFEQTHKRIVKETNRAHAKANFKVGAAVVGAVGIGIGLLSIQFFTIGLLTLLAAGGALTGYMARVRQNALANRKKATKKILPPHKPIEPIEVKAPEPTPPRLEKKP